MISKMKDNGQRDTGKGGDRKSRSSETTVIPTLKNLLLLYYVGRKTSKHSKKSQQKLLKTVENISSDAKLRTPKYGWIKSVALKAKVTRLT